MVDLSADKKEHLHIVMRHLQKPLLLSDFHSLINEQSPELIELYALGCRLDIDIFKRLCVWAYQQAVYYMAYDITHEYAWLTNHTKFSRVMMKLGSFVEVLYSPESDIPTDDQQLRLPLLQLAAWVHQLLTKDEQKEEFDRVLEVSGTFARELLDHIKSVMTSNHL